MILRETKVEEVAGRMTLTVAVTLKRELGGGRGRRGKMIQILMETEGGGGGGKGRI